MVVAPQVHHTHFPKGEKPSSQPISLSASQLSRIPFSPRDIAADPKEDGRMVKPFYPRSAFWRQYSSGILVASRAAPQAWPRPPAVNKRPSSTHPTEPPALSKLALAPTHRSPGLHRSPSWMTKEVPKICGNCLVDPKPEADCNGTDQDKPRAHSGHP